MLARELTCVKDTVLALACLASQLTCPRCGTEPFMTVFTAMHRRRFRRKWACSNVGFGVSSTTTSNAIQISRHHGDVASMPSK